MQLARGALNPTGPCKGHQLLCLSLCGERVQSHLSDREFFAFESTIIAAQIRHDCKLLLHISTLPSSRMERDPQFERVPALLTCWQHAESILK